MYSAYQVQSGLLEPVRKFARVMQAAFAPFQAYSWGAGNWAGPCSFGNLAFAGFAGHVQATVEMFARAGFSHQRPAFGIDSITDADGHRLAVQEEAVDATPFATLLRFRKATATRQPKVLVVAPLSGHFATLLRGTVRRLLADHDVYLTDWHNGRDVPVEAGRFGFDEHVDHMIRFIERMGPGGHVLAVCQPCVQVLAAVALMAEANHVAQPMTMTLMAGPIDARVNPTEVNRFAMSRPLDWFERHMVTTVPARLKGSGRRVYPGFLQVLAFVAMNRQRHVRAHRELYRHIANGETTKAQRIAAFYDEYFAVADLPAEFYLETVQAVFQDALLPNGKLTVHGRPINPAAIRRTALLTVEGEDDDICSVGQTAAAHELCSEIPAAKKHRHVQPGVGHYGVFSGRAWEREIYPVIRRVIATAETARR